MTLIDGDRIVTAQLYDDEHEEFTEKKMSIIDIINAYTDEGVTVADNVLDKIRAEILDCLKSLDEIEKSGLNIHLPNEISGRRLTYQQCLEFIDKCKTEIEPQESEVKE